MDDMMVTHVCERGTHACEMGTLSILKNLGWKVKSRPVSGGSRFSPDFLAEKKGLTIAVECKAGLGTFADVAILRNTKANKRVVVAEKWATNIATDLATRYNVQLVPPQNFSEHLQKLAKEAAQKNAVSRLWGTLQFLR